MPIGRQPRLGTIKPTLGSLDARRVRPPVKRAEAFYTSTPWRTFVDRLKVERSPALMARQGHLCEDPACPGPHSADMRVFADHLKERQDGGADFDKANVMLRCGRSHSLKTAEERRKRSLRRWD